MAAEVAFDVVEQILLRLDVKDLIRCKGVCKLWYSFVSSPRFVKAHLNRSYNNDRCEFRHKRIARPLYLEPGMLIEDNDMYIVGSCNDLVCFSPRGDDAQFAVTNPSTRDHTLLQTPPNRHTDYNLRNLVCCGFGYDSSADDYKVIVGFRQRFSKNRTLFYVLTLKSNIWKLIGEVKYKRLYFFNSVFCNSGVLCRGALHWYMTYAKKRVILSLDLSTDEFKEISEPTDGEYECYREKCVLGSLEECLCIYEFSQPFSGKKWIMKNNKWELLHNIQHMESMYDIAHDLTPLDSHKTLYILNDGKPVHTFGRYLFANTFVNSLVSLDYVNNNNNNNDNDYEEGQKKNELGQEANEIVECGVESNLRKRKRDMKKKNGFCKRGGRGLVSIKSCLFGFKRCY